MSRRDSPAGPQRPKFDASPSCVVELMKRYRETRSLEPARQRRPPGGRLSPLRGDLIETVEARPDTTMPELADLVDVKPKKIGQRFRAFSKSSLALAGAH
ncbi:MAG: hypothetical protein AAGG56_11590 [Pseudomonadota bacterium]